MDSVFLQLLVTGGCVQWTFDRAQAVMGGSPSAGLAAMKSKPRTSTGREDGTNNTEQQSPLAASHRQGELIKLMVRCGVRLCSALLISPPRYFVNVTHSTIMGNGNTFAHRLPLWTCACASGRQRYNRQVVITYRNYNYLILCCIPRHVVGAQVVAPPLVLHVMCGLEYVYKFTPDITF